MKRLNAAKETVGCLRWLMIVGTMLLVAGCEVEPVSEAPLENDNPGYGTAERMYGSVAAAHAEEDSEVRKDWEAGGEPAPEGGYSPYWEHY